MGAGCQYPDALRSSSSLWGIRRPGTPQVVNAKAPDPYVQAARKIGKTPSGYSIDHPWFHRPNPKDK
jgi:hypothetical protein